MKKHVEGILSLFMAVVVMFTAISVTGFAAMPNLDESSIYLNLNAASKSTLNISTLRITTENKSKRLKLTWNKLSGVSGYQVYRSTTGKSGSYKKIATLNYKKNTYTDTNLKSSKVYYYAVRGYKKSGNKYKYGKFKKVDLSTRLTKAYVDKLYDKAQEVYSSWLYSCRYASWDKSIVIKGKEYFLVKHKTINTVKKMKNYVEKYFAKDMLKDSYLYNAYIDYKGKLYVAMSGVGSDLMIYKSAKILSLSDKKCKYRRYYDDSVWGGSCSWDHTFIYKDHRWKMTGHRPKM